MEFRVFNRWGQEVFYSNDNQHGWDGTWKNVPQDMGSYTYLIRLGYPDGLVETFKGEITLVR
jgi:gliding motility-associated-like protein